MAIIRHTYEGQLLELRKDIRRLGLRIFSLIQQSVSVLSDQDINHARAVVKKDTVINRLDHDINEQVIMLITKQQPIATDLRLMIAALKISSEFERIGDNAANIAQIRKRVKFTDNYILMRLDTMGKLAMLMLKDLNTAVREDDITLIKEIIIRDEDIDDLFKDIINTTYLIDNDPFVAAQAHLAARYLERIGDHIANISEHIYYYMTGERYESYDKN
ncbi:phosphate signaling complex protein PhoU [Staphylococcus massiliensis]|uniref:phosphate signaling complex protein PhoU n=1 Tax=Staphylococcus massiliensis TaxID=555791 RepID=UPI001EDF01B2|nr:phosphate signaling complex protein PhoU [Staphylococcus massiliensis]MCG3398987.1 phosphate signaling complex protein PhoU [Staphylococcus massiliensis]MCG3401014.1 phosphate signaling complex protein PhoU [Staphylococcus massiliensis]